MRLTISEAAAAFDRLVGSKSSNTARAYRTDVEHFKTWAKEETSAHALYDLLYRGPVKARLLVERYLGAFKGRAAKNSMIRRVATLKSFVSRARRDGMVPWRLEVEVPRSRSRDARKGTAQRDMRGPDPKQFRRIMEAIQAEISLPEGRVRALRDRVVLGLLENPMLRRSELAALNIGDLSLGRGKESVEVLGKGRDEPEKLPIPPGVAGNIREWLAVRGGTQDEPLLVGFRTLADGKHRMMKSRLSESAIYNITIQRGIRGLGKGSKRLNPHALRHTGASKLMNRAYKAGIPTAEVMKVTRHKKAETLEKYLDIHEDRARKLVRMIED